MKMANCFRIDLPWAVLSGFDTLDWRDSWPSLAHNVGFVFYQGN